MIDGHRLAVRQLLEDLARETGSRAPEELASQLQMLFEGAVIGALIDWQPEVARVARQLALVALRATAGVWPPGQAPASAD